MSLYATSLVLRKPATRFCASSITALWSILDRCVQVPAVGAARPVQELAFLSGYRTPI